MKTTKEKSDLSNILIAVALIMGFIFAVSFTVFYVRDSYGVSCDCNASFPLIVAGFSSLGVFVGVLTYYVLSKSFIRQKEKIKGNVEKTLNFLENEERLIIKTLIDNQGSCTQNVLSKLTGIDPVKLHRRLKALESKDIISKDKNGMTNELILKPEFKDLFIR